MTLQPVNTKIFVNRATYSLLPFAVMVPEAAKSAVELDGESGVLRLTRVGSSPIQDAGVCYLNGPQITGPTLSGSCSQGVIAQALIRQDDSDGIDNKALIVPGALIGPVEGSQGLAAGGSAYRFLGFEGCPIDAPVDPQRPKHKFRIGWVAPSYSQAARFFKCEERRMIEAEAYIGTGLIQDVNRLSLAGGTTRPILSSPADFTFRRAGEEDFGSPELPEPVAGDGGVAAERGAVAIRCERDGVFLIGFTASCNSFNTAASFNPLSIALLVERASFVYRDHIGETLKDTETHLFRVDWQEGVYARSDNSAEEEESQANWVSLGGQTIVDVKAGDILHIVNGGSDYIYCRYLNVWGHTLPASGLPFD